MPSMKTHAVTTMRPCNVSTSHRVTDVTYGHD